MKDISTNKIIRYMKLHILGSEDVDDSIIWLYDELQLVFDNLRFINIEEDFTNGGYHKRYVYYIKNYATDDDKIVFKYREQTKELLISLTDIWLYFNYKHYDIFTYRELKKIIIWYVNDKFGIKAENVQIKKWS